MHFLKLFFLYIINAEKAAEQKLFKETDLTISSFVRKLSILFILILSFVLKLYNAYLRFLIFILFLKKIDILILLLNLPNLEQKRAIYCLRILRIF